MLLEELWKVTELSDPDAAELAGALKQVAEMCAFMNEDKRVVDNRMTLEGVRARLTPQSLTLSTPHDPFISLGRRFVR